MRKDPRIEPLTLTHPEIAQSWHPHLNGDLKPENYTAGSPRRVWWLCSENPHHEWRQVISRRLFRGCPMCKLQGRSLAALYPAVAAQWHPTLNEESPEQVYATSAKKAWWQCDVDPSHVFEARIGNRTSRQSGCPFCSGDKVCESNSLATLYPEIAQEWHPRLNKELTPSDVTCGSDRKVWWLCARTGKHEWQASIDHRTGRGNGCPICRNGRGAVPEKTLAARFPDIAKQWHPTMNSRLFPSWDPANRNISAKDRVQKNRRLQPSDVSAGSKQYAYWQCPKSADHVWCERIAHRTYGGSGCPFCSGRRVASDNNLAAKYPAVAKLWHPTRNGAVTPNMVTTGNAKIVWWRCFRSADHVWQSQIVKMVQAHRRGKSGCPFCAGRKAGKDNNLAKQYPAVAELWHPTRNLPLRPVDVVGGSHTKYWWQCRVNPEHVWDASVINTVRASRYETRGCPYCSGHRVAAENSLKSRYPEVAAYWDKSRNGKLGPKQVTAMSNKEVFWRCPKSASHRWSARVCYVVTRYRKGKALCLSCKNDSANTK